MFNKKIIFITTFGLFLLSSCAKNPNMNKISYDVQDLKYKINQISSDINHIQSDVNKAKEEAERANNRMDNNTRYYRK
ncbi:lpp [Wigglesworthia glossinidia endosymbiont of Glossina brevipalpis]|uniref:Major outer membrane lipoprotein Lpp n=1 Tax=Wigglesworthia glossinidia brevipalpis TaxID=36870 RepID=Q8D2J9_WIGBR|nr:lpp [Wigglesworthia glossinidia endosymbiont of Glossina brevipalpis]